MVDFRRVKLASRPLIVVSAPSAAARPKVILASLAASSSRLLINALMALLDRMSNARDRVDSPSSLKPRRFSSLSAACNGARPLLNAKKRAFTASVPMVSPRAL
ncbi:hypothetical protein D3C85_1472340 [compost metagenome]